MNKVLLVALSKLLNLDQTVIETELGKEDGSDLIMKGFYDKYKVFSLEDLGTLIKNSNKKFLEDADFEIESVPKPLYSKIQAAVLTSKERGLAKEYGITEFKDLSDLLFKIAESTKGKGVDETLKTQIETLKGTIKSLEAEKNEAVTKVQNDYESELTGRDFTAALSEVALDYEADVIDKQKKLLTSAFGSEFKVERKNKITLVLDKDGKPVLDKLGDPEKISNVIKTFASDYGFKLKTAEPGGRGTASSQSQPNLLKGKLFEDVLKEKGIQPLTAEADKAYTEWQASQK